MKNWLNDTVKKPNEKYYSAALQRQAQLTKPPGSLGKLEELAVKLASLQASDKPEVARVHISVFAADHGVAAENVSAFPQSVTVEMIRNFVHGGAAISVLAKQLNAKLEIINLGTATPLDKIEGVIDTVIAPGTRNFMHTSAMTESELQKALAAGRAALERAFNNGAQLFIGGEMGIANTSSATAIACALLRETPQRITGPGTGLNSAGVLHKAQIISAALQKHATDLHSPLSILQCLGGFEIAALCGAYIAAAQKGMPVLVDGFIASVAALTAVRIRPEIAPWLLHAHYSAEPGYRLISKALAVEPLLNLGLRLGEGSGAAIAVPLLRAACAVHNEMATFSAAEVSAKLS